MEHEDMATRQEFLQELKRECRKLQRKVLDFVNPPARIYKAILEAIDASLDIKLSDFDKYTVSELQLLSDNRFRDTLLNSLGGNIGDNDAEYVFKFDKLLLSLTLSNEQRIEDKVEITTLIIETIDHRVFVHNPIGLSASHLESVKQFAETQRAKYKEELVSASNTQPINKHTIPQNDSTPIFIEKMNIKQQTKLADFIKDNGIANAPVSLVDFLVGKYDGRTHIEITNSKIDMFAYLVVQLYAKKLIKLSFGKGYLKHIEMSLFPFSQQGENRHLTKIIRNIKRSKSTKANTTADIDILIKELILVK